MHPLHATLLRHEQVVTLGIIVAVGALEARTVRLHPGSLPLWMPYEFSWTVYACATVSLYWYARGILRAPGHLKANPWRQASFVGGVLLIYAAMQTQYDYAAQHMFFLHRAQHLVLHHLGPFLIALGNPGLELARGMPAWVRRCLTNPLLEWGYAGLQQPVLACVLFVGLIYLWPAPPVHFFAMLDPRLYTVMNWSVTVDGILFWLLVLDPRPRPLARLSYGGRLAACVAVMFPQIALGALVAFCSRDLFSVYAICGRIIAMTGVEDQHLGGLILWIPGAMMSVVGALLVLNFMRLDEERSEPALAGDLVAHV